MQDFADIPFPLSLSMRAAVRPEFSTRIVALRSGHEYRSSEWADARLSFDVGPALTGDAAVGDLIAFFRARRGPAQSFRFRDPTDFSSNAMTGAPTAEDQYLGAGDGLARDFPLVKLYGADGDAQQRRIVRPAADSLLVALDGAVQTDGWRLGGAGVLKFDDSPPAGAIVTAGFLFDVEVRFAEDFLDLAGATHGAAELASVPLVEVKGE